MQLQSAGLAALFGPAAVYSMTAAQEPFTPALHSYLQMRMFSDV